MIDLLGTKVSLCVSRKNSLLQSISILLVVLKFYDFLANENHNEVSIVPCYCLSHEPASAEVDPSYYVLLVLSVVLHWTNNINGSLFVRRNVITRNY